VTRTGAEADKARAAILAQIASSPLRDRA